MIVSLRPLRPWFAPAELFPALGVGLMHTFGVIELQRRKLGAPPGPRRAQP